MITANPFKYWYNFHQKFLSTRMHFWGALIGGVLGYQSSRANARNASRALEETRRHNKEIERLGNLQQKMAEDRQQYWEQTYKPLEMALASQAQAGYDPKLGEVTTDVNMAYDKAGDIQKRNALRYGINPNSGRFAGVQRGIALDRAKATAGARTGERRRADEVDWNRRSTVANMGRGIPGQAMQGIGSAANTHSSAASNMANMANTYGNLAAGSMRGFMNLGSRFDDWVKDKYEGNYGNAWGGMKDSFNSIF